MYLPNVTEASCRPYRQVNTRWKPRMALINARSFMSVCPSNLLPPPPPFHISAQTVGRIRSLTAAPVAILSLVANDLIGGAAAASFGCPIQEAKNSRDLGVKK